MKTWPLLLVVLAGCSNQVELVADHESTGLGAIPAACVPPTFEPGQCVADVVNDGTGPSDHRQLCRIGGELWTIYPSGETWRVDDPPDGKRDPVICHVLADGTVQWMR